LVFIKALRYVAVVGSAGRVLSDYMTIVAGYRPAGLVSVRRIDNTRACRKERRVANRFLLMEEFQCEGQFIG
jgi:ABC-type thiamine transport system ATPase subunit